MDTEIYQEKYLRQVRDSFEFLTGDEIQELNFMEMQECPKIIALKEHTSFGEWKEYLKTL